MSQVQGQSASKNDEDPSLTINIPVFNNRDSTYTMNIKETTPQLIRGHDDHLDNMA